MEDSRSAHKVSSNQNGEDARKDSYDHFGDMFDAPTQSKYPQPNED